jgi:UDP-N-acetylglucosamine--N-acetylmuramyl-(pentapeptide) pyrophosphoryl-undecaprenol N-acetylglucosamine transferase
MLSCCKNQRILTMYNIVFTGGGSAGHVTPNIALINDLDKNKWQIAYIGSAAEFEQNLISKIGVPFYPIHCGKLRRYFSWKNFLSPLLVLIGILQSLRILRKLKTNLVFSKGGFVAFPVVVAAKMLQIPVIIHESDRTPGLANALSFPFAQVICSTFDLKIAKRYQHKIKLSGSPLRKELFQGSAERAKHLCNFSDYSKPCILVMGGGFGSKIINDWIRQTLDAILKEYNLIHLCGPNNIDNSYQRTGYLQIGYANEELCDLLSLSDFIISRAGSNSLYEILALAKPHILIPLALNKSRGDQIANAKYFADQGISYVIAEENLNTQTLLAGIAHISANATDIKAKINALAINKNNEKIIELITNTL